MDILLDKNSVAYAFSTHRLIRQLLQRKTGILYTEEVVLQCILNVAKTLSFTQELIEKALVKYLSRGVFLIEDAEHMEMWYEISTKFKEFLRDENISLQYELGRGGTSVAFNVLYGKKEAALVLIKNPKINKEVDLLKMPKNTILEVYIDDIIDVPIYDGYDRYTRSIVMQLADKTLSEKIDEMTKKDYTKKYDFAATVIHKIFDVIKRLAKAGYEHTDMTSLNVGVIEKGNSFELRMMDLEAIEIKDPKLKIHTGWISQIYYDLVVGLDMANVAYNDDELYPEIIKWKSKPLLMHKLIPEYTL